MTKLLSVPRPCPRLRGCRADSVSDKLLCRFFSLAADPGAHVAG